jgi:hypothetical protein
MMTMKAKFAWVACIGLLAFAAFADSARAQAASPPLGTWSGTVTGGGAPLSFTLGGGGGYLLQLPGAPPVTGVWTWNPTSVGGILTLHYRNAGFHNKLYYSITYVDANTIIFSDPYFRATLRRQ